MAGKLSIRGDVSLTDRFTRVLRKVSNSSDKFSNQMNKSFGGVNNTLAKVQDRTSSMAVEMAPLAAVGAGMVVAGARITSAGQSILSAFGAIIEEGAAFEKTMSNLAAVSRLDKTSAAFQELEQKALDLGASTVFSSKQVGEGMEFLARAGFTAKQQLKAIPDMLSLATVGNIELARAADIASNTMGAFADQNVSLNRVANVMAATMVRSNVSMEQMAETLKFVAPIANKAGVSIEQLAAMTGLLGNVGIQGSLAGTALRAAIIRLAKPPKMAAKALKKLGIETMDAAGNLRNIPSILEDIRKKTAGFGSGVRLGLISDIFGKVASSAMTELIAKANKTGESIESFAERIKIAAEANQLAEMARKMADNVEGANKAFESASSAVKIGVFASIKDIWKKILQIGAKFLLMVFEFTKRFPNLTKWITIIAAALGILLVVLGALVSMGGMVALAFVAMKIAAAAMLTTVSAVLVTVGWVVLIVLALVAAIALAVVYWDEITAAVTAFIKAIAKPYIFVIAVIWALFEAFAVLFNELPGWAQFALAALLPFVFLPMLIYNNWGGIKAFFADLWAGIVFGLWQLKNWFRDTWNSITVDFLDFLGPLGTLINIAVNALKALAPDWLVAIWEWAEAKILGIINRIGARMAKIGAFFGINAGGADESGVNEIFRAKTPASSQSPIARTDTTNTNKEMIELKVRAENAKVSATRRGKKSPGLSLNMGETGACG